MSYGAHTKWGTTRTRARAAGSSSKSKSATARRSGTRSAPRARRKPTPTPRVARPRSRSRKAPKVRTYVRYDPDTGLKVKVPESDERFDSWPSRKPSARARSKKASLGATIASKAVEHVVASAARSAASRRAAVGAVGGVATAAEAAGLTAGTAAAALAAGVLAFYATRYLKDAHAEDMDSKRAALADGFRQAHRDLAKRLGRPIRTSDPEFTALSAEYKRAQRFLELNGILPPTKPITGVL